MKYSSIGLKDRPNSFQGDEMGSKPPHASFCHPRSVPLPLRNNRSLSDTSSNLYQLVSKRKLTPESLASHSLGAEDGGLWQTKRARREVDMTGFEAYKQPRETRSQPFFDPSSSSKHSKFNPPPLEPIVVRKELNRSLLHPTEEREPPDRFNRDYPRYCPLPDLSSQEELHMRNKNTLEKYLTPPVLGRPEDSRIAKDHFVNYYHLYQKLTSRDTSKIPLMKSDSIGLNDPKRSTGESHRGEEMNIFDRANYLLGHLPGGSIGHSSVEGSLSFQEYQRFRRSGFSSEEEFRKYLERDKFHKTVDQILRTHKQHGLPLTEEYIKHVLPTAQPYQKPQPVDVAPRSRERPVRSQHPYQPSQNHSSMTTSKQLYGGSIPQPWQISHNKPNTSQDNARRMKNIARNDENRKSVSGPVGKESTDIISLAIKRIGRGRFGVLECLNNFAHQMYRVEKKWKTNDSAENIKNEENDFQNNFELQSNTSNHVDHNSASVDSYDDAAPLDLSTAVSREDDNNSRGSEAETSVSPNPIAVENIPLPIKKRTAKYRSYSEDDPLLSATPAVKQQTNEAIYETNDNSQPLAGREAITSDIDRVEGSGSVGFEVTLEKRLKMLIETPDEGGNLPLHLAVMKNDLDVTSALVREMNLRNMSLDRYNRQKQTPLHLAIKRENHSIIKLLIGGSSSWNIPDGDGNTAIHLAIAMENLEILQTMSANSGVPIDATAVNRDGLSVLNLAEKRGMSKEFSTVISSQIKDNNNKSNSRENPSSYSDQYQQQRLSSPSFESITPPTQGLSECFPKIPLSPSLFYSYTSSPAAPASFTPPVLSPCGPNTPPLSPSSSSSTSSSMVPSPLAISFKPPIPQARTCLPLSSSSQSSSSSSSLSMPTSFGNYVGSNLSLSAAC